MIKGNAAKVVGPFFFENDGSVQTVRSDQYINLLKAKFSPALHRRNIDVNDIWFQQNGASPHAANMF